MKKTSFALSVAALAALLPLSSFADVAFNVGAVTDYRYRGISQTRLKPALQGGVDYTQGGLYLGAWASTIKWIKDGGGDANVEIDLYGGYKGEITKGLGYDVGLLAYVYPSNKLTPSADTQEIYGALSFGPATLKYSHSVSNLFAATDSKNSGYLDLSASFEVMDGWSVAPHLGHQTVKNHSNLTYTDFSITLSKDFKGLVPSIAIVGNDVKNKNDFTILGKELSKTSLVLGLKYNF
ncbi:hypothetical protein BurJ1DRAFT_0286 [Burkholderiales bacterium JOSHI_001]|nr:hypothetical protein BurJ1DRAFT_0286 [Burkholderiales bacterium JOSHI_001]